MSQASRSKSRKAGQAKLSISVQGLLQGAERTPPNEFRVFQYGENPSEKGTFFFTPDSAIAVMNEYVGHGKPLFFDYNHGTTLERSIPEEAITAGEFVPEIRDDGLWATKCLWTDRAAGFLRAGEYRMFSPFFHHDDTNVIDRLINVALTNFPALDGIQPLVAASANRTDSEDPMACESCSALNTRLSAMDEKCKALEAKLSAYETKVDEKDKEMTALRASGSDGATKLTAAQGDLAKLTAAIGQDSVSAALGTVAAWKTKAEGYDALKAESEAREAASLDAELETVLERGLTELKITPATRAHWKKSALSEGGGKSSKAGIAFLSAWLKDAPAVASGNPATPAAAGTETLTATDKEYARKTGVSEASVLKAKQQIADRKAARTQRQ